MHAGPSNLSRTLATAQLPTGPFSALRRVPQNPPSPFVSRPRIAQIEEVEDDFGDKTPGHKGLDTVVEESGAKGTEAVPEDSEYWDEKVTEDFTKEIRAEFEALTFDEDLDPALKPWQKRECRVIFPCGLLIIAIIPREIKPGEPIILPLSSLGSADPTAPVSTVRFVSNKTDCRAWPSHLPLNYSQCP